MKLQAEMMEEENEEGLIELNTDELKERLTKILTMLEGLLGHTEGQKRTELVTFLCSLVEEFQLDVETDLRKFEEVSLEDKLEVLKESDRGELCFKVYRMGKQRGLQLELETIMRGLLSPGEVVEVEKKAKEKKGDSLMKAKKKGKLMSSLMGKGILLLAVSMTKYSWYKVMKENYEQDK